MKPIPLKITERGLDACVHKTKRVASSTFRWTMQCILRAEQLLSFPFLQEVVYVWRPNSVRSLLQNREQSHWADIKRCSIVAGVADTGSTALYACAAPAALSNKKEWVPYD